VYGNKIVASTLQAHIIATCNVHITKVVKKVEFALEEGGIELKDAVVNEFTQWAASVARVLQPWRRESEVEIEVEAFKAVA
jgi:hypothetical protein